ncbi:bifunctional hydroxymethylpyrimidine kinase/phosphomethylpyrimidine kinase [Propionivibrio dicarboxylicus]|uniref:hydroxymethylpyrimidine kinase n=1 Tax=Propionivibrio dicarboxylicus TaxID=83767 RepID=A0A1G7X099_9RHOO|nr:hydroxymethylpyrimidine/phosphomethylpyrimidine kinase [Propionivibrio dicarboxylicus]SDG77608.1 hydroxymethylpyrimidine/phosphomethylpyrimidine kinase [Propionivibrio dicarboxylicus]
MDSLSSHLSPPLVLSFAATDSTGAAGVAADLMTLTSMGCHPLSVVTAITVQDSVGVSSVLALDPEWVEAQARAVLEDMPVDAFKLGMLGSADIIAVVAAVLADYPDVPVVFDPVLSSGGGAELADDEMVGAMKELILPQTTLLTPNTLEIRRLADDGKSDADDLDFGECAKRLLACGCRHVLLTGTHENTQQVVNTLYGAEGVARSDHWDRLAGAYHGAGCTLASAAAAGLAHGLAVGDAVREAQDYTWQTLAAGFRAGMGQFIPDRFFWARRHEAPDA